MSGIEIDVNLKADSAKKDLQEIRTGMKRLLDSTRNSGKAFEQISPKVFQKVKVSADQAGQSMQKFRVNSGSALKNTATDAKSTSSAIDSIKTAVTGVVAAFAAFQSVSSFNKASDNLTNIQNKLRMVTASTQELVAVQNQLYRVSQNARSDFGSTATVYASFAKSVEQTGVSSARMIKVVDTLQKGISLSGASAEGAKAAMIQLGQGLSSGTLRGEELNSVLEQLPYIGNGIAKSLGMTTGAMRELAAVGGLTPQKIIAALEDMASSTDKEFGKTVVTAEQGVSQLGQAVSRYFGELSHMTGSTERFANRLLKVADVFSDASQNLRANLYSAKQTVRNFIDSLDLFSATQLTMKAALTFDISPMDLYDKYKFYKAAKENLDSVRYFFGIKPPLSVNTGTVSVDSPELEFNGEAPENAFKPQMAKLGKGLLDAIRITGQNIAYVMPVLKLPMVEFDNTVKQIFQTVRTTIDYALYDSIMPVGRALEGVVDRLSLFSKADNRQARAWVDLFKSDNLVEFNENLQDLNDVRKSIRFDDKAFVTREAVRGFRDMLYPVQDLMIFLNLMDNKLIRIRDTRFDRLVMSLDTVGNAMSRIYSDVLLPKFGPAVAKFGYAVEAFATTSLDILADMFNRGTGEKIAQVMIGGILDTFEGFGAMLEKAFKGPSLIEMSFGSKSKLASSLKSTFVDLGGFIVGFFSQSWKEITSRISAEDFVKAFSAIKDGVIRVFEEIVAYVSGRWDYLTEKISNSTMMSRIGFDSSELTAGVQYITSMFAKVLEKTSELSNAVVDKVYRFGEKIKDIFFETYDAVVGHSYWPDLVDEVNAYTDRLVHSEDRVAAFADIVTSLFKNAYSALQGMGGAVKPTVMEFVAHLKGIDYGTAMAEFRDKFVSIVMAGLTFAFGGWQLKVAAIASLSSIMNSVLNDALNIFAPGLSYVLGKASIELASNFVSSLKEGLNSFSIIAPSLFDGLVEGVSPLADWATSMLGWLPLINNQLLEMMLIGGGLAAIFSSNLRGKIGTLLMGKEGRKNKNGELVGQKDGVFDYVGSIFRRGEPKAEKAGVGLIEALFDSPKLALLSAGFLATSLLDGVSLLDAAEFALPTLAFAIFGRDNGAKLATDALEVATNATVMAYDGAQAVVGNFAGKNSILYKMFEVPRGFFNYVGSLFSKGDGYSAFGLMYETAKQAMLNVRSNIGEINKGNMTWADGFLTTQMTMSDGTISKRRLAMKQSMVNILDDVLDGIPVAKKAGAGVLTSILGNFELQSAKFRLAMLKVRDSLSVVAGKGIALATTAMEKFKMGLSGVADLVLNRYVAFGVLALGLTSTAFAASATGDAIGVVTDNLSALIGIAATATAGLMAYGAVLTAVQKFKDGAAIFTANAKGESIDLDRDAQLMEFRRKKTLDHEKSLAKDVAIIRSRMNVAMRKELLAATFDSVADRTKAALEGEKRLNAFIENYRRGWAAEAAVREAADLLEFEDRFRKSQDRVNKIATAKSKTMAGALSLKYYLKDGAEALRQNLVEMGSAIAGFARGDGKGVKTRSFLENSLGIDPKSIDKVSEGFKKLAISMQSLSKMQLLDAASNAGTGLLDVLTGFGRGGLSGLANAGKGFKAVGRTVKTAGGGILATLKQIGGSLLDNIIKPVGTKALPLLKKMGLWGAGISVAGVIGVGLFGSGDDVIDKLEWAYDKARSIIGLGAVTGEGRKGALSDMIGGFQDVGNQSISFEAEISRLNFDEMSDSQYDVLMNTSQVSAEAFKNLNEAFIKQGSFTAENLKELARIEAEQRDLLNRMPQNLDSTFAGAVAVFNDTMSNLETSIFDYARNFLALEFGLQENVSFLQGNINRMEDAAEATSSWFGKMGEYMTSWPAMILGGIGTVIGMAGGPVAAAAGGAIGSGIGAIISAIGDGLWSMLTNTYDMTMELGAAIRDSETAVSIREWFKETYKKGMQEATEYVAQFKNKPTAVRLDIQAQINELTGTLPKYANNLGAEDQKAVRKAYDEVTAAALRYSELEGRLYRSSEDDSEEDYINKRKRAFDALNKTLANYKAIADRTRPMAESLGLTKEFTKELEMVSASAKTVFGVDFGDKGKNFMGSQDDLLRLGGLLDEIRMKEKDLENAFDPAKRRQIKIEISARVAEGKNLIDQINAANLITTDIPMKVRLLPNLVNADDMMRLFTSNPEVYKGFDDLSDRFSQVQAEFDSLTPDTPVATIQRILAEMANLRKEAAAKLPLNTAFDQLNAKLQEVGATSLSVEVYSGLSSTELANLAATTRNVQLLKDELALLYSQGADPSQIAAQLKKIGDATAGAVQAAEQTKVNRAQGLLDSKSLSGASKALAIARTLGVEMPENIATSSAAMEEWSQIQVAMAVQQLLLNSLLATGAEANSSAINDLSARLAGLRTNLESVTDMSVFTFDSLLGQLQNTGMEISDLSFAQMSADAQRSLVGIGTELEALTKKLSEASISGLAGDGLSSIIARRQELLAEARLLIADSLHNTGAGIAAGLGRVGADDVASIAALAKDRIGTLLEIDKQMEIARLEMENTTDVSSYLKQVETLAALERKAAAEMRKATTDFSKQADSINEVFSTGLDTADFAFIGDAMFGALRERANELQTSLAEAMANGADAGGRSVRQVFADMRAAARDGQYVAFFANVRKSMEEAVTSGARTAFETLSSALGDFSFDFSVFAALPKTMRDAYAQQGAALDAYSKALDLPGMTQEMADVLNQAGKPIEQIMTEFGSLFGTDMTMSADERLISSMDTLREAFLAAAGKMGLVEEGAGSGGGKEPKKTQAGTAAANLAAFRELAAGQARLAANASLEAQKGTTKLRDKAEFASSGFFAQEALNLANSKELKSIIDLSNGLRDSTAELQVAVKDGLPTDGLQKSIQIYKSQLSDLEASIQDAAVRSVETGKSFASSVTSGFNDAFRAALEGESEEGKGVMQTFLDSFLDTFTNSVLDAFTTGLLDPLTGDKGVITQMMKGLGQTIFDGINPFGQSAADAIKGDGKAGAGAELVDAVKENASVVKESVDKVSESVWESIGGLGETFLTGLTDLGGMFSKIDFGGLGGMLKGAGTDLMGYASTAFNAVKDINWSTLFLADGGQVAGPGTSRSDSIPAMLSNGEFVVNAAATKKNLKLLHALNSGRVGKFAEGGLVSTRNVAPVIGVVPTRAAPMASQGTTQEFNITITGDISRQTKSEIYKMLPQIAVGVNAHNREKNIRG